MTSMAGARRGAAEYRWVAALALVSLLATAGALLVGIALGIPTGEIFLKYTLNICILIPPTVLLMAVVMTARCALRGEKSPFGRLKAFMAERFGSAEMAAGTLGPILLLPLLMGAFGTLKQTLPLVHAFALDDSFARADRFLFLGWQPWQLTHALFGVTATWIIDRLYTAWIPMLFVLVLYMALFANRLLRARFFLTFGASWIVLGVLGAIAFSSAGPCFAPLLSEAGAQDYAALVARLAEINRANELQAVTWQGILWDAHIHRHYGFAMGVSAMPSMHNAIAFLYLLCGFSTRNRATRGMTALFAAVVFVGSIHLGWHYAVDGVAAWGAVAVIWWGSGWYLRRSGYVAAVRQETEVEPVIPTPAERPAIERLPIAA
jgi:hypothetical protein